MVRVLAALALCALVTGTALAQTSAPPSACARPAAPILPERAPPGMTLSQLSALHDQRDAYVSAADRYRLCLDRDIEERRDTMFRTNAEMDPVLDIRAQEHSEVSAERAQVMGRFVLLCLSWEDANRTSYPRSCYLSGGG